MIPLYKNKGDHKDCGNYRGISLLSVAGKIMAKVVQNRLSTVAEAVLTESQCGFRRNRSTIDMIFSLRQLQEKAIEQQKEIYIVFIDFKKAFDTVDRRARLLWRVLKTFGCPDHLIEMVRLFHDGAEGRVVVGGQESERFSITHGTKQGCVLAPTLFSLFLTVVLLKLSREIESRVHITTRSDGRLFNLARLKAKTRRELVTELLFADDTAVVAHDQDQIQRMVNVFAETAGKMGLQINTQKTEVLYQPAPHSDETEMPQIVVDGEVLKVVGNFKYLGSTVTADNRADREIACRIQSASASFGKLEKKLWNRPGIRLDTKCKVYKAVVQPALLYSTETYTLYRDQIRRLEAVQQIHLWRIMKVKWYNYVSDAEVLRRSGTESIEATLAVSQLRWTGHVIRMEDSRIPKMLLYGELASGSRKVGG